MASTGKPWHFVDFSRGRGTAITNEAVYGKEGAKAERKEYVLDEPSVLAIKGLGQFKEFRVVSEFRSLIENWHISDFHIGDARPSAEAGYAEHLSTRGDNVAQVAQYPLRASPRAFRPRPRRHAASACLGSRSVEAKPTEDGRLVLRFQDGSFKDPFIARYVSDGTIKMFAYLVLLYDPKPHPASGRRGAREPALPRAAPRTGRGIPRLRAARRPGLRVDALPGVPERAEARGDLLAGQERRVSRPCGAPARASSYATSSTKATCPVPSGSRALRGGGLR